MDIDYGVALARMRNHDDEAKELLERWISGADDINSHITTRVYLARIYSRIGESDKAKELYVVPQLL
jgi:Tfp pilus assembly protein PilF